MKISIIGCGNMGKALASQLSPLHAIYLYDHHLSKSQSLEKLGLGKAYEQDQLPLSESDFIILAVKPQSLDDVVEWLKDKKFSATLISLLTGTTISSLKKKFGCSQIVRMMPNLAITCGQGAIALVADESVLEDRKILISDFCEPLGKVYWISETKINAFTSLAGSGPAFVLAMIESMVEAGIAMGFNAQDAQGLTLQMMSGTIALLSSQGDHPGSLRWKISSPGGTTIAGLKRFEEGSIRGNIMNVFLAAYERAKELS